MQKRKLIEVALPLEAINRESAREKSIRQGHPSTLHIWWARRPLAAARAVLFAQLVDDPSAHPEDFPTEDLQRAERDRLHRLIERLVVWENIRDEKLLAEAHAEILKSADGAPPPILDPFAGGGTIPLEAQRLGLEARASDLNPVAVLIEKALIELPSRFADREPIFPTLAEGQIRTWKGVAGLAADVYEYGRQIRNEAAGLLERLYPAISLSDGSSATVIAWIWARTLTCPNPACGIEMPLVRSWWLSKKKNLAYIVPSVIDDATHPSGRRVVFSISHDKSGGPTTDSDGTVGRLGAQCLACNAAVPLELIRKTSRKTGLGQRLMAVVAEGARNRLYLEPDSLHEESADVPRPIDLPEGELFDWPGRINVYRYGLTRFPDLFTNRQLVALTTFSDLISNVRDRVLADGGDPSYADAVATYLGLWLGRILNRSTSLNIWNAQSELIEQLFARNAIPMMWHFPEVNPFSDSSGNALGQLEYLCEALLSAPAKGNPKVDQADAASRDLSGAVLATDPPYYDNIDYSDLSDFFYVWLRRTLKDIYPSLLSTMLVPKAEELVANPYRHGDAAGAKKFFEDGFRQFFAHARSSASMEYPVTVWYAFKQSETDSVGQASTGWETLLEAMIGEGWTVTSTWPMRSERTGRLGSNGTNSLASAIALSLRPRAENAATVDRREFISTLEKELPDALRKLQQGQIAPVDLPQAAIGPGMAIYSRYAAVLEPDGRRMAVRAALARVNETLDRVLNEQEGDFDSATRFGIAWYRQHGYGIGSFGDADNLSRAQNTSVDGMDREGILSSRAGKVQLIAPDELSEDYDVVADLHTSSWEVLHHLIKTLDLGGVGPAGALLREALSRTDGAIAADLLKELAHLLFRIAESAGRVKDALSFNTFVTSWPEILAAAQHHASQTSLVFDQEN